VTPDTLKPMIKCGYHMIKIGLMLGLLSFSVYAKGIGVCDRFLGFIKKIATDTSTIRFGYPLQNAFNTLKALRIRGIVGANSDARIVFATNVNGQSFDIVVEVNGRVYPTKRFTADLPSYRRHEYFETTRKDSMVMLVPASVYEKEFFARGADYFFNGLDPKAAPSSDIHTRFPLREGSGYFGR
jgi:hypothetical protein